VAWQDKEKNENLAYQAYLRELMIREKQDEGATEEVRKKQARCSGCMLAKRTHRHTSTVVCAFVLAPHFTSPSNLRRAQHGIDEPTGVESLLPGYDDRANEHVFVCAGERGVAEEGRGAAQAEGSSRGAHEAGTSQAPTPETPAQHADAHSAHACASVSVCVVPCACTRCTMGGRSRCGSRPSPTRRTPSSRPRRCAPPAPGLLAGLERHCCGGWFAFVLACLFRVCVAWRRS
jgi:hypothetical protein